MLTNTWFILRVDLAKLATAKVENGRRIELETGERYITSATDGGSGVLLASGNYANPISDPKLVTDIQVNTAAIATLQADNPNNQTGTAYTLIVGDENKTIWMNNAADNVLTIPVGLFVANTLIMVMMEGVGVTSITAEAGVLLNGVDGGTGDLTQFNGVTLVKRSSNNWIATPLTVA